MQEFSFARIVPHLGKGIRFADGNVMLRRQGWSSTINGALGRAFIELHPALTSSYGGGSRTPMACELFYEGPAPMRAQRSARQTFHYFDEPGGRYVAPVRLQKEAIAWAEVVSDERPGGILQQVHGYTYSDWHGSDNVNVNDVLLSRFRYDSVAQGIFDVDGDCPVAEFDVIASKTFVPAEVRIDSDLLDPDELEAFQYALQKGFHQCDIRAGADSCMRRLAWLASDIYLKANIGKPIFTHVLQRDVEHAATLTDIVVH